jgi:folate-binding protein YgfZ
VGKFLIRPGKSAKKLPLHQLHKKSGARFFQHNGWTMPHDYGNYITELQAAYNYLGMVDRSYLGKITVSGPDALDLLHRISTNDLMPLSIAPVCDTTFITPKGKIVDFCRIINMGPQLLLVSSYSDAGVLRDWINRFIILEDVTVQDSTRDYIWLTILGPAALDFVDRFAHGGITDTDENVWFEIEGINVAAYKNSSYQIPTYELIFPTLEAHRIFTVLTNHLKNTRGKLIGEKVFQVLRIENGLPEAGAELTGEYNPLELRLQRAISFSKGCYTGQEVIARLDSYDKIQKYLMRLEFSKRIMQRPPLPIYIDQELIGQVTSYCYNPCTKIYLGLSYIKKIYSFRDDFMVEIKSRRTRIPAILKVPPYIE